MTLNSRSEFIRSISFYPYLSNLTGRILEVGISHDRNIQALNTSICAYAISPNTSKITWNSSQIPNNLILYNSFCEQLPFASEYFDYIIGSFVLCSVKDQGKCLSEIKRVLKPKGKIVFIEHTISKSWTYSFLQKLMYYPVYLTKGCRLTSNPENLVTKAGFEVTHTEYISFSIEPHLTIVAQKLY